MLQEGLYVLVLQLIEQVISSFWLLKLI